MEQLLYPDLEIILHIAYNFREKLVLIPRNIIFPDNAML